MASSDAQQIEELEKELQQINTKKEKLEKKLRELKDQQQQQRVNRRRRNLPAELKVEIVDCLPVENAVHFLANVPNRLIIHHCAPRIRRMIKMIYQIAADYGRILSAFIYHDRVHLKLGHHQYTPEMDIFLRYGSAHSYNFYIRRGISDGFVGYPADFFNDLIKHYYEMKVPSKALRRLRIELPWENPAQWPAALIQPLTGEMKLVEKKVDNAGKLVEYILLNKYNPGIAFTLWIYFEGDAQCYQQMTCFSMAMARAQSHAVAQLTSV